ncbi:MAG TPA: hypothetical protein VFC57_04280 [Aeromicrobium sp.]|nr:hypothetical protein [Aeromicrobium sp.]
MNVRALASVALTLGAAVAMASCTAQRTAPQPPPTSMPTAPSTIPEPPQFEVNRVLEDIGHLANEIGPRHATSKAYLDAADWVEARFETLGYETARMDVDAPAGNTWPETHGESMSGPETHPTSLPHPLDSTRLSRMS